MAPLALTDCFIHVGYVDLTSDSNEARVDMEATALDATVFGNTWTVNTGGVKSGAFSCNGFIQSTSPFADSIAALQFAFGSPVEAVTMGPEQTEGTAAYIFQARRTRYSYGGSHGELGRVEVAAPTTGKVTRGRLAVERQNVSATGALGTGIQLGAVGATQYLYATFHVFSVGTTITAVVESDDNSGFTSATTRATIGPITTLAGTTYITPVAGAITDDYWRFRVTAITGTFSVAAAFGIGA